jgi:cytochrome c
MGWPLFGLARARGSLLATLVAMLGLGLSPPASAQGQAGSAAKGQAIFESRCGACHSLDTHRVGPALGSVLGRAAGKALGFGYSQALGAARHVWDRDKLLAWLTDPESVVPGQAMGYRLEQAEDRRDVVAYLASLAKR